MIANKDNLQRLSFQSDWEKKSRDSQNYQNQMTTFSALIHFNLLKQTCDTDFEIFLTHLAFAFSEQIMGSKDGVVITKTL